MTLNEIKMVVEAGGIVCHQNHGYQVIKDCVGQWLIKYVHSDYCIGLTHRDGVTMNGKEEDFFIAMCPMHLTHLKNPPKKKVAA